MTELETPERAPQWAVPGTGVSRRGKYRFGEGLERRQAPALVALMVVAAYGGVVILEPGLAANLAFCDGIILALCVYAVASMMYRGSVATSGAARLLPWFWLILLGSFLGLATVGIPYWAMSNLARTVFALITFVCLWHLLIVARLQRLAIIGTAIGVGITVVVLITQSGRYRAPALFPHPNYAGHYMSMACMLLFVVSKRWYSKVAVVLALVITLQVTSSFGAIAMVIAMIAVYGVRLLTRNTAILAAALAALVIGGLFLATPQVQDLVANEDPADWTISESLSVERFQRSGDTRLILWSQALAAYAEQPLGIGPDGVRRREVAIWRDYPLEIHSDGLGYLVERGVPGLIGFIGLWATLIYLARKRGLARVLIAGFLVQGLFRETMHYRHGWLLLALAFAIDHARANSPPDDTEVVESTPDEAEITSGGGEGLTDRYFPGVPRTPLSS